MSAFALYVLLFVAIVLGLGFAAVLVDVPVLLVVGAVLVVLGGVIILATTRKSPPGPGGPTTRQGTEDNQRSASDLSQNVRTK